jgi:broad specificity phosphatase PhoE
MYSTFRSRRSFLVVCLLSLLGSSLAGTLPAQSATTLRIYLARHGETDWNVEGRLQGGTDIELNAKGREQAMQLAQQLKDVRLDAVYSSTLRRSRDTAEMARGRATLQALAGLSEQRVGKFQGQVVVKNTPINDEFERRRRDPNDDLDGGESLNEFFTRVRNSVEMIRNRHRTGTVLIVGHSRTNQMILRAIFGWPVERSLSVDQANDELYLIEFNAGNGPRLWKLITDANVGDL